MNAESLMYEYSRLSGPEQAQFDEKHRGLMLFRARVAKQLKRFESKKLCPQRRKAA